MPSAFKYFKMKSRKHVSKFLCSDYIIALYRLSNSISIKCLKNDFYAI